MSKSSYSKFGKVETKNSSCGQRVTLTSSFQRDLVCTQKLTSHRATRVYRVVGFLVRFFCLGEYLTPSWQVLRWLAPTLDYTVPLSRSQIEILRYCTIKHKYTKNVFQVKLSILAFNVAWSEEIQWFVSCQGIKRLFVLMFS